MIKTELSYNPYLVETKIKFNGNEPKINSLVERYMTSKLQFWIKDVPSIFHDEMNGYDFELLFSGTNLEFEELKDIFAPINKNEEQVRLVHLNKLESREQKVERISVLLDWLNSNRNEKFDYEKFYTNNNELITESYNYIVLHADLQTSHSLENKRIKVENIHDITELKNTNLKNTPILICVNQNILVNLQQELKLLLSRDDVNQEQLFFYIDKNLSLNIVERVIKDLEIEDPQILKAIDDEIILKYFEIFPITEYINKIIIKFERVYDSIKTKLDAKSEILAVNNKEIHEQINALEYSMELLTKAINLITSDNDSRLFDTYLFLIEDFEKKIFKWRSRKTKLYSASEAYECALELSKNIIIWSEEFKNKLSKHEESLKQNIDEQYNQWYVSGEHEIDYVCNVSFDKEVENVSFENTINEELLKLKEEKWVVPGKGLIAQIFNSAESQQEPTLQTTWQISLWKEHVQEFVNPLLISIINRSVNNIKQYKTEVANDYKFKLVSMYEDKLNEKNSLISQLSNEERQLEIDYNWLAEFKSQLVKIERE